MRIRFLLAVVGLFIVGTAFGQYSFEVAGIRYTTSALVDGGEVAGTGTAATSGVLTVPEKVNYTFLNGTVITLTVTGWGGLNANSTVTSINFPSTIKGSSGGYKGCTSLTHLTLAPGMTFITHFAFEGCTNLETVTLHTGIEEIMPLAFRDCPKLTEIIVPGNTIINLNAFYECTGLKTAKLGTIHGIKSLGSYAFYGCTNLETVTINGEIDEIGPSMFEGCTSLTSVTIPESVKKIWERAFYGCEKLKLTTLPKSLEEIKTDAFRGCAGLKLSSAAFPEGLTMIYSNAFNGCASLDSVSLPKSLTYLDKNAFNGCTNLEVLSLEGNLKYIQTAFPNCPNIKKIYYNIITEYQAGDITPLCSATEIEEIVIGDDVILLPYYLFYDCNAKSVILGRNMTSIGAYAFRNFSSLTTIEFPEGVTEIGNGAFISCSGLQSLVFPEGLTRIRDAAFYGCSGLREMHIPAGVTSIGTEVFKNCTGMTNIYVAATKPPSCYTSTFENMNHAGCVLHVPVGTLDLYKAATGWKLFNKIVESNDPSNLEEIGNSLSIYPNPTTGIVTIEGAPHDSLIRVFDLSGNLLKETYNPTVDMTSYASGTYILSIGEQNHKIIKQ